jgi:DNA invertase Pin-like site-specific DNA recombinase
MSHLNPKLKSASIAPPANLLPDRKNRFVGYLRVSTLGQNLETARAQLLEFANQREFVPLMFIEEVVSGKVDWKKRELGRLIEELQPGDVLIVSELSRLARSAIECLEILALLLRKEVAVFAVNGKYHFDGSIQSTIMALALGIAAQIERELISERTIEGLKLARKSGKKLGRPPGPRKSKLDIHRDEIQTFLDTGAPKAWIARYYKVNKGTFYKWLESRKVSARSIWNDNSQPRGTHSAR